jgi:2-succinyl-6-hydroxy-2,4-cyclohexadiene-1-carboxylate synthase
VQRLVLISTTAGIEDEAARRERETSDNALATRLEIEGTEAFLSWWLNRPLFATLAPGSAGLADRLTNTAAGLASSLRTAGVGCQAPLWGRLTELGSRGVPVLLIAGELDAAYCRHAERMASAIGAYTRLCFIEGAGHACHLEQPAEVAAAIDDFLQRSPERA